LRFAGFVTALSDSGEGAVTLPGSAFSFNPARPSTAFLAGEMPSLREGDRIFLKQFFFFRANGKRG
jgi:hypothetical protein